MLDRPLCGYRLVVAWLTAHRHLARDYERDPAVTECMIHWAAIAGMLNRLTHARPAP
jgi:hypothetical protein